jgi:hypothetical protein
LAKAIESDIERLCDLLRDQKKLLVRRALIAWERSPQNFSGEIIALNDIDEALGNNCSRSGKHRSSAQILPTLRREEQL